MSTTQTPAVEREGLRQILGIRVCPSADYKPSRNEARIRVQRARLGTVTRDEFGTYLRVFYESGLSHVFPITRPEFLAELRAALRIPDWDCGDGRHVRVVCAGNHTVVSVGHPEESLWVDGPWCEAPGDLKKCTRCRSLATTFPIGQILIIELEDRHQ